jgi:hypothetical protein
MLAYLSLQRAQLMLRHAPDGSNATVAKPKLSFLPTPPHVDMGRLAPVSTVEQKDPAPPFQDCRHDAFFLPTRCVHWKPKSRIRTRSVMGCFAQEREPRLAPG